jgi:4-amino-4-deoxy-L-arabinose transferase-like glycosyltransferase
VSVSAQSRTRRLAARPAPSGATVSWLIVGLLLILRIVLSVHLLGRPGLEYDETLFVNAATLRIPGFYLPAEFHGIPLMVFYYIGALKSWLYAPLFSLFGTTVTTIRLPVVLIASLGLVLLYVGVRDLVNRSVALLTFVILCFDHSIFWLTRDDIGPSAIELFMKCLAVFAAARFARGAKTRWVCLCVIALGLGVFNKLNFIWTVNAAAVASFLVLVRYRRALRAQWRPLAVWIVGLALIYGCFGAYYLHNHIGSLVPGPPGAVVQPWSSFKAANLAILTGTWWYDYLYGQLSSSTVVVVLILGLFAVGTVASMAIRRTANLAVAALAVVTLLTEIQVLFTVQATAGWHYISIYPTMVIVVAYGAYVLATAAPWDARGVHVALASLAASALIYDGVLMAKYQHALSNKEPVYSWSGAIYQLSDDLQRDYPHAIIFTADWGIANQLFALHPSRRYSELAFSLAAPTPAVIASLRSGVAAIPGQRVFVTHANGKLAYPNANVNLLKAFGGHLHLARTISGLDKKPLYQVYVYS